MGILRSYFTPEQTRRYLAGKREAGGHVLAALLGVATPFCSCSAVPLFIGFVTSGVPLGVTFSFLIAAPLINEVALVLLGGLFGWQVATLYGTVAPRAVMLARPLPPAAERSAPAASSPTVPPYHGPTARLPAYL